jgi:putative membrane protein
MMMGGGLILTLLVLGVVVFALIKLFPDWQDRLGLNSRREDSAEETLRQRFARGEIDQEEYEQRLRILREESTAAHR